MGYVGNVHCQPYEEAAEGQDESLSFLQTADWQHFHMQGQHQNAAHLSLKEPTEQQLEEEPTEQQLEARPRHCSMAEHIVNFGASKVATIDGVKMKCCCSSNVV